MSDFPAHLLPNIFLGVQLRCVRRQPLDMDLMVVFFQELADDLGIMSLVIVHKQDDLAHWMSRQLIGSGDGSQQTSEANIIAALV